MGLIWKRKSATRKPTSAPGEKPARIRRKVVTAWPSSVGSGTSSPTGTTRRISAISTRSAFAESGRGVVVTTASVRPASRVVLFPDGGGGEAGREAQGEALPARALRAEPDRRRVRARPGLRQADRADPRLLLRHLVAGERPRGGPRPFQRAGAAGGEPLRCAPLRRDDDHAGGGSRAGEGPAGPLPRGEL